jgi:hypothetical protein
MTPLQNKCSFLQFDVILIDVNKICNKCKIEKSEEEFFFQDKSKNKRHNHCKACYGNSRRSKEHYAKYKDEYLKRAASRNARIREENFTSMRQYLKDKVCLDCGETDPVVFEFDHRNPSEKKYGISKMMPSYNWPSILTEIEKCDVVCANCHKRRTAKQFGWRKFTR